MKKLLTLLGSVGLIASTSAAVVACGDRATNTGSKEDNKPVEQPTDQPSEGNQNGGGMQEDE
ncbi:lipoprotein, partial [Mycoplasma capricolum]|uniref:lipoprotein n=1 Tax=Mycoplasma capricolum TaxID=2095 RepID=UPI000566A5F0